VCTEKAKKKIDVKALLKGFSKNADHRLKFTSSAKKRKLAR
jgi:hypothetical protein